MHLTTRIFLLPAFSLLLMALPGWANTIIDTRPANTTINPFGEPNTATYGQTVTVPVVDSFLNSFTFSIDNPSSGAIDFAGYVAQWDGLKATGPILYESAMTTLPAGSPMTSFTFVTGSLALTPGLQYVLFLSASKYFDGTSGLGSMAGRGDNPYAGGQFVFFNNGNNFGALTTTTWDNFLGPTFDSAFQARFSGAGAAAAVPLPSTAGCGLLLLLAIGVSGYSRARRSEKLC